MARKKKHRLETLTLKHHNRELFVNLLAVNCSSTLLMHFLLYYFSQRIKVGTFPLGKFIQNVVYFDSDLNYHLAGKKQEPQQKESQRQDCAEAGAAKAVCTNPKQKHKNRNLV